MFLEHEICFTNLLIFLRYSANEKYVFTYRLRPNNINRFYLVIIIQIKQFRRFEIEAKNYSRLESISFMSIVTPQRFVSMIKNIVL